MHEPIQALDGKYVFPRIRIPDEDIGAVSSGQHHKATAPERATGGVLRTTFHRDLVRHIDTCARTDHT